MERDKIRLDYDRLVHVKIFLKLFMSGLKETERRLWYEIESTRNKWKKQNKSPKEKSQSLNSDLHCKTDEKNALSSYV